MMGLTTYPDPDELGVDLRVLNWGRELSADRWRRQFAPSRLPHPLATKLNRSLLRPLAQSRSRADVIHYPFHYLPNDWTVGRGAKIVTVHGASAFSRELWDPKRGERIKRALHSGFNQLAKVITVSEWSRKEIAEQFDLPDEKIVVIPNGVRLELFRPLTLTAQPRHRLQNALNIERPYLLHVGPCEPRKNPLKLVQAYAILKHEAGIPHSLVLAGAKGRLTEAAQEEIRRLRLDKSVIMTGPVDDSTLVRLYNSADLFIFPSLYEGFGIPVLEAMACGTPVVASNCAALPEVGHDAVVYIDDPTDSANIAVCIESVLCDARRQKKMRERGLQIVQNYSWRECALRHLQLYRQIGARRISTGSGM